MTMIRLHGAVILVVALVGSVFGAGNPYIRAHNQFLSFFPASEAFLPGIIQSNCTGQFANYTNKSLPDGEGHAWAGKLIDCVLPACTQGYQNEFTVSGLLIGLLPAGVSQFGPSMEDLALLATRRPVLAFLAFGTPSPNLGLQGGGGGGGFNQSRLGFLCIDYADCRVPSLVNTNALGCSCRHFLC